MKIVSILGARPQFIKAAPVSKALRAAGRQDFFLHIGQHYDYGMSQVFFEELNIPEPDVNLGVGSGDHGWQTGQMLIGIEKVLLAEKPD
ncbi:MAG: UDP-N-acetylglucosamine 2-epimerase [Anaerolineales bacterium]|nr:UDP-N-acetylglucosamine 2-epimerase [Anaerolineales bacterium]